MYHSRNKRGLPYCNGDSNSGMADDDGYGRPVRQQVDVKFLADDKYEKNQAQLTEG